MNTITATTPDLFAWSRPTPERSAPTAPTAPKVSRQHCPFVISGAPVGNTPDLETLIVDGTGTVEIETLTSFDL